MNSYNARMTMEVVELSTPEYRNKKTGQRVHAPFPEGYNDEVNYGGTVKAFAFLLGNECNVSHDKVRLFLSELTGNEMQISKGMINGLCEEFSSKTEAEQKEAYKTLLSSPVMNTDFTNANVNVESAQVLICVAPDTASALFIAVFINQNTYIYRYHYRANKKNKKDFFHIFPSD